MGNDCRPAADDTGHMGLGGPPDALASVGIHALYDSGSGNSLSPTSLIFVDFDIISVDIDTCQVNPLSSRE